MYVYTQQNTISRETSVKSEDDLGSPLGMPGGLPGCGPADQPEKNLSAYEVGIISGVLRLSKASIQDVMLNMRDVFMLSDETALDKDNLQSILQSGFSRIPVYKERDRSMIKGYLLVKSLVVVGPQDNITLESDCISLKEPCFVRPEMGLLSAMTYMRESRCHLALVCAYPETALKVSECIHT
jgi:metal transporter CNNM